MTIRITTLSENTAMGGYFLGEWGLSVLVETKEMNVLLDTGNSNSMIYNADSLGIDPNIIDKVVLSHGHFDHTGGLRHFLRRMKKRVEVIGHPAVWQSKYARREGQPDSYIGIPFLREELESMGADFLLTPESRKISESIITTGEVPMITDFEQIDSGLYVKETDGLKPDKFLDDQALIVKTAYGLIVILGCAHRGIINTLYQAQKVTGISEIHTVIGGAHLLNASKERLEKTLISLRELDVKQMGLCHCTGLHAISRLSIEFGDRFFYNGAGNIVQLH